MEKVDFVSNVLGKKDNIHYSTGTLYTNSPRFFMKYYLCNEVEECGVVLSGETISRISHNEQVNDQTNAKVEEMEDKFISFPTAQEAVDKYKTALKVIDVETMDKVLTNKEIWEWIKKDILDIDKSNIAIFGLIWLFSDKSVGYTGWLAFLCLLCNLNLYEVVRMVRAIFIKGYKKECLETEAWQMGLSELIYDSIKKDDLKLYLKVKDGNFRFK